MVVLLTTWTPQAAVIEGPITNPSNGHVYYLLASSPWSVAEAEAVELHGHLVTINDAVENAWVYNTFIPLLPKDTKPNLIWIGLNDVAQEGQFVWASGEPVTFVNWSKSQPDNANDIEHYVNLWTPQGLPQSPPDHGKWNDLRDNWPSVLGVVEATNVVGGFVPLEGGVRIRAELPTGTDITVADGAVEVRVFADLDGNGRYTDGEPVAHGAEVHVVRPETGPHAVCFSPPPYDAAWPPMQKGRRELSVEIVGASPPLTLPAYLIYTSDVVTGVKAVEQGFVTACAEALESTQPQRGMTLLEHATRAASRTEGILGGLFRRAKPLSASGGAVERAQLCNWLESFPVRARDFINGRRPAQSTFSVAIRSITSGQTLHTPIPAREERVILSLATGSLVYQDGPVPDPGGAVSGGRLYLPVDDIHLKVAPQEAHGWGGMLSLDLVRGLLLTNLTAIATRAGQRVVESVASEIGIPAIALDGFPDVSHLYEPFFSHLYLNPSVEVSFKGHDDHEPDQKLTEWVVAAAYWLPLLGGVHRDNAVVSALSCRQTYALCAPYSAYEPLHCLLAGQLFPQVSFSVSDPEKLVLRTHTARVEQRFTFNPQEGHYSDEVHAGLFRDKDYFRWRMNPVGTLTGCQPVPFWWNLFRSTPDTVAFVEKETIFDTDGFESTYISPDNMHLHRWHPPLAWLTGALPVEAPGSFNGTIHLHWRWGKQLHGFGGGKVLLPPDQIWVMGLSDATFPTHYTDFVQKMTGAPLLPGNLTLLMSCRQYRVTPARQYETFGTGFAYGLGTPLPGSPGALICEGPRIFLESGGYQYLAAGFGDSPQAKWFRERQEEQLWRIYRATSVDEALLRLRPPLWRHVAASLALDLSCSDLPDAAIRSPSVQLASAQPGVHLVDFSTFPLESRTPLSWMADDLQIDVSAEPASDAFLLTSTLFADYAGPWLAQTPGTMPATLSIQFGGALKELHGLPLFANRTNDASVFTLRVFRGGEFVASTQLVTTMPSFALSQEGHVNWRPREAFDRLTITPESPAAEFGLGNFLALAEDWVVGDLNYDGAVDEVDLTEFNHMYVGQGQPVPAWAAAADFDGDGDVDGNDYTALLDLIRPATAPCSVVVRAFSGGATRPVLSGASVPFAASAADLSDAEVSYRWSASDGMLTQPSLSEVEWLAPVVPGLSPISVDFQLEIRGRNCITNLSFTQTVVPNTFANWVSDTLGGYRTDVLPQDDEDGDSINNLTEYLLGLSPEIKESIESRLSFTVTEHADRHYLEVTVVRRKDAPDAVLKVAGSPDLVRWELGDMVVKTLPPVDLGGVFEAAVFRDQTAIEDGPAHFLRVIVEPAAEQLR